MDESDGLLNRCRLNPYPGFESRTLRLGLALGGVFALLASSARAQESYSPTAQYLAQRKAAGFTPDVTLDKVAQDPRAYAGRAVEIEGTIPGLSPTSDGGTLLIFRTKGYGTLTLKMSSPPTWLQPGALVRALCIVATTPEDTLSIGLPEMEIIAVASATDIAALEARLRGEQERRAQAHRQAALEDERRREAARATLATRAAPSKVVGTVKKSIPVAGVRYELLSAGARSVFPAYRSYIKKHNKRLTDSQADQITFAILFYSEELKMDPRLIVATVIAESDFKVHERSRAGAMGLIQLMPDEVERLKLSNPYDPIQNLAGGIWLLKERLNKYSRSTRFEDASLEHLILTLASYNAGEGAVKKYGGVPPYRETRGYVKRIMALYKELTGTA